MSRLKLQFLCLLHLLALTSGANIGDRCYATRKRIGTCKRFRDCPAAIDEVKRGGRPVNCGFQDREPIVCCPGQDTGEVSSITVAAPPTSPPSNQDPGRIAGAVSTDKCYEYSRDCGSSLVGGTKVQPKEFPHMAAIGYGPRDKISWVCGGSLISEKFVLTAAHCITSNRGKESWVLLGSEAQRSYGDKVPKGARPGQTHPVIRRIRHPQYLPPSKYNDIALLEIGPALESYALSLHETQLHPACLPVNFLDGDPIYVATGWGRVGYGEDPSLDLLKVELQLVDPAICNDTFEQEIKSSNKLIRGIDKTMICAGWLAGGKDTCQGDSGGPLQVPFKNACMYEIWGITSFGKICGAANSPAVYTRVSEYIPWIESIVWP